MASGNDSSSAKTSLASAALLFFCGFALCGLVCVANAWRRKRYVRYVLHHRGFILL